MNRRFDGFVLIVLALVLAGCARAVVPHPSAITLESAMVSVGKGLVQMKEAEGNLRTGLLADEVQVTFNISATGTDSSNLYVEVTPVPTNPLIGGKAGAQLQSGLTAQRGNQITIKFKNIMTAPTKDTLAQNIPDFQKLLDIIKGAPSGGPLYLPKPKPVE